MRIGVLQLCSSDDPLENLGLTKARMREAVDQGATLILTPEVTNCVSMTRSHQERFLSHQSDEPTLEMAQQFAEANGVSVLLGSISVKTGDPDGRFANRSVLIDQKGEINATYDKIHMFDVTLPNGETYHESKGYRPGGKAVLGQIHDVTIGMTICYDLRFPALYRMLAQAGAQILTIPSAFSPTTGAAHWRPLLRARAIETGCFVIAPAQTGIHASTGGKSRETYGHSMVISPWGEVLLDAGKDTKTCVLDIDLAQVGQARRSVPSLLQETGYTLAP